jgi:hypothetical protein
MRWFKRKTEVPFKIDAVDVTIKSFPMHILGLNPWTGQGYKLLATQLKGNPTYFLPTITKDGLFELLSVPDEKSYLELLTGIHNRGVQLPKSTVCRMAVGTGVCFNPSKATIDALPYEVVGFSQASPELEKIFHTLELHASFPNDPSLGMNLFRVAVDELQKEPMKTWINRTLENLEHELNWTDSIVSQVEGYKRQHGLA